MLIAVAGAVLAACGPDGGEDEVLRPVVEDIEPAIAAVDAERGGLQRYYEINATPQFVNLFVADAATGEVTVYLYHDGELEPPTPPAEASGPTFDATAVDFDADTILAGVTEDLPESDVVVFAITAGPAGEAQLSATVQSERGGVLDVMLSPTGEVLSVDPRA